MTKKSGLAITKTHSYTPPIAMRRFVHMLCHPDVLGNISEAARKTGIDRERYHFYMRTFPEFRKWSNEYVNSIMEAEAAELMAALVKKGKEGDVSAIRLWGEFLGRIRSAGNINIGVAHSGKEPLMIVMEDSEDKTSAIDVPGPVQQCYDELMRADLSDDGIDLQKIKPLFDILKRRPGMARRILEGELFLDK